MRDETKKNLQGVHDADRSRHRQSVRLSAPLTAWMAVSATLIAGLALAQVAPALAAGTCPNEAFHAGPSASLPDCRAYEMVTPVEKQGRIQGKPGNVATIPAFLAAGADGQHVLFDLNGPIPGSPTGQQDAWVDTRTSAGWIASSLEPAESLFTAPDELSATHAVAVTPTFSEVLLSTTSSLASADKHTEGGELYLRKPDGTFEWISQGPIGQTSPGPGEFNAHNNPFGEPGHNTSYGTSLDLRHVVFSWRSALLPEALAIQPGYTGLYERFAGSTVLVDVNDSGQLIGTCGASLGGSGGEGRVLNDVSDDGARVFFMAPGAPGCVENEQEIKPQLYVREGGRTTVEISAPAQGITDRYGPQEAHFAGATPDGEFAFFTSHQRLTADANTGPEDSSADLYAYDLVDGRVTDLSSTSDPAGAQLDGEQGRGLVGFSEDGQLVYFVAAGQISGQGIEGQMNLFLSDHGQVRYIATLGESPYDKQIRVEEGTASVTPDGLHLLFQSTRNLTGYDSKGNSEVYEFNEPTNGIVCVSCNPTGASARGNAFQPGGASPAFRGLLDHISDDGSYAFFESEDALVPQDTNGATDVYEYHNGKVSLISAGRGEYRSEFLGATPSGSDVFFGTNDSLAGQDTDGGQWDIYDARVDGGFPASEAASSCSSADTCKAIAGTPAFLGPATTLSTGQGNPAPPVSTLVKPKTAVQIRAEKLAKALKACRAKHNKRKRASCKSQARKQYGSSKAKKSAKRGRR